jgi:hypothetical protein
MQRMLEDLPRQGQEMRIVDDESLVQEGDQTGRGEK